MPWLCDPLLNDKLMARLNLFETTLSQGCIGLDWDYAEAAVNQSEHE